VHAWESLRVQVKEQGRAIRPLIRNFFSQNVWGPTVEISKDFSKHLLS